MKKSKTSSKSVHVRRNNALLWLLPIILILIIFSLVRNSRQSPSGSTTQSVKSTNNLTTIANEKFSFQYPKDWSVQSSDSHEIILSKTVSAKNESGRTSEYKSELHITNEPVSSDIDLNGWMEMQLFTDDQMENNTLKTSSKKVMLGNSNALYFITPGSGGYNGNGVISVHNGYGYMIKLNGYVNDESSLQTVIKTFKFL